jgi:Anti-sigma-K factor rskA, C-terminal
MTAPGVDVSDRLHELLIDGVLVGLKLEEAMELQMLLAQSPSPEGPTLEHAAAAIMLAALRAEHVEAPPHHLMTKLDADATRFFFMQRAAQEKQSPEARAAREAERGAKTVLVRDRRRSAASGDLVRWMGWIVAALCLGLAGGAWYVRGQMPSRARAPAPLAITPASASSSAASIASMAPASITPQVAAPVTVAPDAGTTPAEQRERLLAEAKDIGKGDLRPSKLGPRGVGGDAVWSPSKQHGFLRVHGLSPNDSSKRTYQVWIYDRSQDPHYPVDGGIFNVDTLSEVVVPIAPTLAIGSATSVVVTLEKAGGVVVSKPDRLIASASLAY